MATKKPPQSSNLETEFFQLKETAPNLEKRESSENNFFVRSVQRVFRYFDNERFTISDAFCIFLLGFVTCILITNIHTNLSVKMEANLLGVRTEISTPIIPIKVINPIPTNILEPKIVPVRKNEAGQTIDQQMITSVKKLTNALKSATITRESLIAQTKVESKKVEPTKVKKIIKKQKKKKQKVVQAKPVPTKKAKKLAIQTHIRKQQQPSHKKSAKVVSTLQQTKNKAMQEGKSSFVLFGASYCMPCRMMKDVMQQHQNVKSYLDNNYRYQYVDIQSGVGALLQLEYNIQNLPTMIIFDKNGRQVAKYEESLSSRQLMSVLESYSSSDGDIATTPKSSNITSPRKVELNNIIADIQETYVVKGEK